MKITRAIRVSHLGDDKLMTTLLGDDVNCHNWPIRGYIRSWYENRSLKKCVQAPPPCLSPALTRFTHFLLLNDFPPPSRSLEQASCYVVTQSSSWVSIIVALLRPTTAALVKYSKPFGGSLFILSQSMHFWLSRGSILNKLSKILS